MSELPNGSGRRIQTVQAPDSCQPQYSLTVLTNVLDERNRVLCKRLGRRVEFIEKLVASDPERTTAILEEGTNVHAAEAGGSSWIVNEQSEVVAVVTVQPILGAKPHEALIVLYDLVDFVLR